MNLTLEQKSDIVTEVTKAAPPVTVAGATIAGMQGNDMILWATLRYRVRQIGLLLSRGGRLHFFGRDSE